MADIYTPLQIGLAVASGIVYSAVGYQVGRRPASPDAQLAKRMFQAWWYGLAGLSVFTPLVAILSAMSLDSFGVMLVLVQALLILVFAAIAGLVYYLLYLYTGKRWMLGAVAVYFLVMLVWLEVLLTAVHLSAWGVPPDGGTKTFLDDQGQRIKTNQLQSLLFGLLIAVPPLLSAVAYFMLYFRIKGKEQRYRIAVVSGALVVWFGASLFGTVSGLSNNPDPNVQRAWQVANAIVSLCASTAVYLAYKPPGWIARRLQDDEPAPPAA